MKIRNLQYIYFLLALILIVFISYYKYYSYLIEVNENSIYVEVRNNTSHTINNIEVIDPLTKSGIEIPELKRYQKADNIINLDTTRSMDEVLLTVKLEDDNGKPLQCIIDFKDNFYPRQYVLLSIDTVNKNDVISFEKIPLY